MKHPIRTRFTLGMIFLFLIILVLSVFSGYYLNQLSSKTSAILKENYLSVVYAREMSEGFVSINQEITSSLLTKRSADSLNISKELSLMDKSLLAEKNNITEPGEEQLVSEIEKGYSEFRESVYRIIKSQESVDAILVLQHKSGLIYQKLSLLSQMNGKALEAKTDDAKASTSSALTRMTILASLCFLIGMTFTISFSSYFSRRFFELYYDIKEIVSSNFDEHNFSDGRDEFDQISQVINKMSEKLNKNKPKMYVTLPGDPAKDISSNNLDELKNMLDRIKSIEAQTAELISRFEKK